ncbi:hypothetical protein BDC45DRAFT_545898 [Circinella umbellata]|nr:hypothetical protein BDC45DRAFT_545898 [Circinella umbellata]
MDVANRPLPANFMTFQKKKHKAPIVWIARNCDATSGRQHYVEQLMKYIDIDSYGDCLRNQKFPEGKDRMQLMSEYKFYLAIENANCDDYVTEKLFDTFSVSTVPIVDGPNSYQGFIPDKNSVVRMDAFPDPRDLAEYISYLDSNDSAYLEHLAFRQNALNIPARERLDSDFVDNWSDPAYHNIRSSWCSICRGILPWWQARQNDTTAKAEGITPSIDDNLMLVDKSCMEGGKWDYAKDGPPFKPDWKKSTHPLKLLHEHKSAMEEFISQEHSDAQTAHIVWTIELILGTLFMVFVAFIVLRGRFLSNQRTRKSEIPMSVT